MYFRELISTEYKLTNKIVNTIKQLSRGRYELKNSECEVIILIEGVKNRVVITDELSVNEIIRFIIDINNIGLGEPSLDKLYNYLSCRKTEELLLVLQKYTNENSLDGICFDYCYWFKLYSEHELENETRAKYNALWIDYTRQLKETGNIIYDENEVNGLWAMPYNVLLGQCNNEECLNRYGNSGVLILETLPDVKYLQTDNELIGPEFKCIKTVTMKEVLNPEIIENLYKEKVKTIKNRNNEYIRYLENENSFDRKRILVLKIVIVILVFIIVYTSFPMFDF